MPSCNYCGEPADTRDHIIPVSYQTNARPTKSARHNPRYGETVPCCRDCNVMLGTKLFPSMEDRCHYVAGALRRRYSKLINAPAWTADELAELGPGLRASILADASRRNVVRRRIATALDGAK